MKEIPTEARRAEWLQIYLQLVDINTPALRAVSVADSYFNALEERFKE